MFKMMYSGQQGQYYLADSGRLPPSLHISSSRHKDFWCLSICTVDQRSEEACRESWLFLESYYLEYADCII